MIASLAMYDRPELSASNDALWALIRAGLRQRGLPAPEDLTRGDAAYWPAWRARDLVLSQTCGLPYRAALHDAVTLIGTPDYGIEDCDPGYYQSVLVARRSDTRQTEAEFQDAHFAVNDPLSQSGWAAALEHFETLGLRLGVVFETGGHLASARAVAQGKADLAAIDAVTWRLICRFESFATDLHVIGQTRQTPGLPLIAGPDAPADLLFDIVADAIQRLDATHRDNLGLHGLVKVPSHAYLSLAIPSPPAQFGGRL
jgi:ABC-type phosphate/phosphonate transport system substrate-binding protein